MLNRTAITLLILGAGAAQAAQPDARALLDKAKTSMAAGQFAQAAQAYEEAAQVMPASPELAYDRGVALYRKGDYAKAAESFAGALMTKDRALEAKAKFNLGNCAYAAALARKDDPKAAVEQFRLATAHYRDAIEANPQDADARANIEFAQRMIKILEEQKKQQQQQDGQDQKDKKDDKKPPQSQPSSQPSSQPNSSKDQKQDQKDKQQQGKSDNKDQKQTGADQKSGQEQQSEQQKGQESKNEEQKGKLESAQQGDEKSGKPDQKQMQMIPTTQRAMTKEEAEKLLQLIRDKERQRMMLIQQMRQRQAKQAPVEKDW